MATDLKTTPLHALHLRLGAKMVPFAGYDMPVQYPMGVMGEHNHCRTKAGLFDVSHMGQVRITGSNVAARLEALMPVDVAGLPEGRQRYGLLTNDAGGIMDDLMFANRGDHWFVVVNAACKEADIAHLRANLPDCDVTELDRALLALQGPTAEAAMIDAGIDVAAMRFMDIADFDAFGGLTISRSGYTGEDGFEISVAPDQAEALAEALLAQEAVAPIGLGARDSLRLEAGLCLYGNDIDTGTTPVEAGLTWAMGKARRAGGAREGGFPGAATILNQIAHGADRRRVGLAPEGRAPMRAGTALHAAPDGPQIGTITSGGFGPTVGAPVSMGYVPTSHAAEGTALYAALRGKFLPVKVASLPFTKPGFKR
ncbi:aminomethyltransferase [Rubricella aquisinus]|uniref:aminomethyltransferase n=1 Tax=Rubricella aquisinus TaxID=2028108 RepID=A0A840WPT6_9RHOB|nr:glycine cleavage system aminomethyltransferase GcvT [Rubricella aquisinus]MBB5515662.1 aminomethyltransferase [Rubricella aquisinus]